MGAEYKFKGVGIESFGSPRRIDEITTSKNLAIITGTSNIPLTRKVARILREDFGMAAGRFPEGEVGVQLPNSVDGRDVYIVQPTNPSADNLMELALMIDACKRADAQRITAVLPYFGFSRSDRKDAPRVPIGARLATDIIAIAGASRIVTVDIHAEQELGFFNGPWNNLFASNLQIPELQRLNLSQPCFVSVDIGGDKRTRKFASKAGFDPNKDTATILKQRIGEKTEALYLEGEVEDRDVVFIDDIINSGYSLITGVNLVKDSGARSIYAVITHGMMRNNKGADLKALEIIANSPITKLFITDTVRQPPLVISHPKIEIISVAPLIAEAIRRLHIGQSLSPDLVD